MVNAAKSQCRDTTSFGKTQTIGFVQPCEAGKMDGNLAADLALIVGFAVFTAMVNFRFLGAAQFSAKRARLNVARVTGVGFGII
jgi:hypothetical protein